VAPEGDGAAPGTAATAEVASPPVGPTGEPAPAATLEPMPGEQPASAASVVDEEGRELDASSFESMSLEELLNIKVVTATKTARRLEEAPAIVAVVTREDIATWGYRTLDEVLRHVPGFYVVDDHGLPNVAVRGAAGGYFGESGTIKVMVDGVSMSFRSTSGNWLGSELLPLSAVERIEIIRGPASALYGADAFLGVVNVITRQGQDVKGATLWGEVDVSTVRDLEGGPELTFGTRTGPVEVLVSGRLSSELRSGLELPESSPAPTLPSFNDGRRIASDMHSQGRVGYAAVTYHASEKTRVKLMGYLSELDRDWEFAPWAQLSHGLDRSGHAGGTHLSLRQGRVGLMARSELTDGLELSLNGFYFAGGPTSRDRVETGSDLCYVRREFGFQGAEVALEGRWDATNALTLVLGTEFVHDRERLPSSLHVLKAATADADAGTVLEAISTRQGLKVLNSAAAFMQAQYTPPDSIWNVTGGLRYDHHSLYGGQISGRLAGVTFPVKNLSLKALYGSAFKAPSPLLLYAVPNRVGDIIGNPDLEPQYVHTFEVQAAYSFLSHFKVSSEVAYSLLRDKAEFTQQGVNQIARNISEVSGLSWQVELLATYEDLGRAYASFELQRTQRELGVEGYVAQLLGDENAIYPSYIGRLGGSAKVPKLPLRLGLEASYIGPRKASDSTSIAPGRPSELGSYVALEANLATVGWKILGDKETVVELRGRNLLGATGPDPGYAGIDYPLAPRKVYLQIRQEL